MSANSFSGGLEESVLSGDDLNGYTSTAEKNIPKVDPLT